MLPFLSWFPPAAPIRAPLGGISWYTDGDPTPGLPRAESSHLLGSRSCLGIAGRLHVPGLPFAAAASTVDTSQGSQRKSAERVAGSRCPVVLFFLEKEIRTRAVWELSFCRIFLADVWRLAEPT